MAWLALVAAALLEIVWALALKQSEGFTRLWPSVIGVVFAATSFVMLTLALRHLPVGTAYAVWVGLGAFGVAVAGVLLLGEDADPLRIVFLALILIGVAGLRYLEA
ncbi:quaternary ammonium compound-resistance protein SugE [Murinocardiopsis flavida]|uniref:Quaternary ammonium compound-resistance protein SugE n=1 Tax=Murinocardiopsis flavida TaxID=645275 RepID=A0A2P8DH20_9ACTN|nr:multidrug efflux SMR transporter [Murinocardiopsis flavida]PSK96503.1 quaternary ammonium compound-resistance protein SugE [Murinocardiopsis flavida]